MGTPAPNPLSFRPNEASSAGLADLKAVVGDACYVLSCFYGIPNTEVASTMSGDQSVIAIARMRVNKMSLVVGDAPHVRILLPISLKAM